jgi:2-C-methyl-D-erythritol 4-phosphate cytidylyltransferase
VNWAALIVAAGRGTRLGAPKQFLDLAGLPMLGWSIRTFAEISEIRELVVATEPDLLEPMRELIARLVPERTAHVVRGGATRQESVARGLGAVSDACAGVLVHDGARPLICVADVRVGLREVRSGRAALLAAPIVDTIKLVERETRRVEATLDRERLWAAQTPQFAMTADLRAAHASAIRDGIAATDDAALLERIGIDVVVVPATSENFKVTHAGDVARAHAILQARVEIPCHPDPLDCHPDPSTRRERLAQDCASRRSVG